jgi:RHS repeat-associated protein
MPKMIFTVLVAALLLAFVAPQVCAQGNWEGPVGVTGDFKGLITTAGAYSPLNHNAYREVTDISVPGALGKYPLKMTRYYNSRQNWNNGLGGGWSYEYLWTLARSGSKLIYPNGNVLDSSCQEQSAVGTSDAWEGGGNGVFRPADGGKVHFSGARADYIEDPYGLRTNLTYGPNWIRVTEPGGRYLQFTFGDSDPNFGASLLTRVEAHGLGNATVTDWVEYHYTPTPPGGNHPDLKCLTRVDYSDGQHAYYSYRQDNGPVNERAFPVPLVETCTDVRYNGPMRSITYQYSDPGPHGYIQKEKYSTNGPDVSTIDSAPDPDHPVLTETRGDGLTRRFEYTPPQVVIHRPENEPCGDVRTPERPPHQFLLNYTDFQNPKHTTQFEYNGDWYIKKVTDANGHWTQYDRGPPPYASPGPKGIGQITKVTHQDGTHIDYTYYDESPNISGHYLKQITDERGNITYHTRDGNHRITRTDHKDNQDPPNVVAYEEFQYAHNNFGLLSTHHLPSNASANGAYVHFQYDSRGLLIAKTNPTTIADWQTAVNQAPQTTYSYYASGPWTDRLQTMTLPANGQRLRASETYEYDLSANSTSRGLVTKITHADGKYQSFGYDVYGNKLWEENELPKRTSYTYDEYNRLLTVKDPIGQTTGHQTTYTYNPTNGAGNRLSHTTSNPDTVITAAGILTTNVYDENFQKKSTTVGSSTTSFEYDNVGNVIWVTDPMTHKTYNTYDNRNRKTSATEAYGTNVQATTVWHYDRASNINQIDRPDGHQETRGYDALNRMGWQNVKRQIPNSNESEDLTTGFGYWPSGKLLWVKDPNQHGGSLATFFQYNESDQLITMYYPDQSHSIVQSWTYDDAHNLTSRTTVNNETQSFTYDNRNRKTGMSWSNGADSASFTYYADNRLLTANNPNSSITRTYDDAGRLASDQQTVTGLGAKNVTYPVYDDDGRVKQIQLAGTYDYTFGYDPMGRFETISSAGSVAFRYAYDLASNVAHRYTYFNSITLDQYTPPDSLNRISSRWIYKNATPLAAQGYTYDPMNRLGKVNWGSVFDWFGYYWDGELAASVYQVPQNGPGQLQAGQDPDLDSDGSIDPWAGYQPPDFAEPEPSAPAPMSLPPRPRPTPYPRPTAPPPPPPSPTPTTTPPPSPTTTPPPLPGTVVYVYDKSGNRTWAADDVNGGRDYVPNDLNQYTSITGSTIGNGNEHEVNAYKGPTDTAPVNYYYINDEHLKQVTTTNPTNSYTLAYDALGRCVKRSLNGATTYYIYDGEKPILEYGPNSALAKNVYGKGIDEILMRTDSTVNNGQAFYYGQDHEGSVTHLINASGNVLESYRYDAFGAVAMYNGTGVQIASTAYNNRFLFTGREYAATYQKTYVPAFKFYEYRARAYNPTLGRFMSEDPKLFDAGDYNLFRYCHNDPIDLTDPMGLQDLVATSNPRQTSLTIAERISLWQRSMESSIGGEQAFHTLQQVQSMDNARLGIADVAKNQIGSVKYANTKEPHANHCNQALGDWVEESGRQRPQVPYPFWGNPRKWFTMRDATANELGGNGYIAYWSKPYPVSEARRDDIIAQQHNTGGPYGHAGVVYAPGVTISVSTKHGGIVEMNAWGFKPRGQNGENPGDPAPVVRHYLGY